MDIEMQDLSKLNLFVMIDRTCGENIIESTWAFKKKRYPDGLLKKFKARFCVKGDQHVEGTDVFNAFDPDRKYTSISSGDLLHSTPM